jgi:uncharacterized protein
MKIHAFRLTPGQDFRRAITDYVADMNIQAGWVCSAVGSLIRTNLRYANQGKGTSFSGFFEIVSVTGTVSVNGCHIHMCVSDQKGQAIGGHVLEGNIINTTAEIIIAEAEEFVFRREEDATTGWKELKVEVRK